MTLTYVRSIVDIFGKSLNESFHLEPEVITNLKKILMNSIKTSLQTTKKRRKPRKKTGWNLYVRLMMEQEEIKNLKYSEKLKYIGMTWKALTESERKKYEISAVSENSVDIIGYYYCLEQSDSKNPKLFISNEISKVLNVMNSSLNDQTQLYIGKINFRDRIYLQDKFFNIRKIKNHPEKMYQIPKIIKRYKDFPVLPKVEDLLLCQTCKNIYTDDFAKCRKCETDNVPFDFYGGTSSHMLQQSV